MKKSLSILALLVVVNVFGVAKDKQVKTNKAESTHYNEYDVKHSSGIASHKDTSPYLVDAGKGSVEHGDLAQENERARAAEHKKIETKQKRASKAARVSDLELKA